MDEKDEKSGKEEEKINKKQEETPDTVIQIVLMAKQGYKEHEIYNVKFGTRSPFFHSRTELSESSRDPYPTGDK